ncbi:FprA family A-type flavoprotein [Peptacetobacter hominis]|uniref:FprA family A-type flavoprotein n=1 Tax=Peptacetobacter hominis TaxID=2743610 RepID=A0A544QY35_9FIRM|nr:FprA family A-type flavoprotein [Peptacetobacter hominis]TQQ85636.1 FprA family A-type flavoprotein [Peptacetobacter hominis]
MSNVFEIKKDLYYTGVTDKDLKVFDIIMETEFGTTYNSYLIKDEKTVLFDTVKREFCDEFIANLKEVTAIEDIDYLVVHHTEPDHSGSIKALLDLNPNIEIYCTRAAKLYLDSQINREFKCHVIADGETLNIGKRTLKFIPAPFLHWVDTMFTYDEYDKVLFTCDAFGAHYACVKLDDINHADYHKANKLYYDCIVKPFAKHVLSAIDKVTALNLDFDTILTSHGPILDRNLGHIISMYTKWSKDAVESTNKDKVSIFYLSAYGNTLAMCDEIVKGLESEGVEVHKYDLEKTSLHDVHDALVSSKGVLLGSPTINKAMVKPMWDFFSVIDPIANAGKIAGIFGSYGWSGEGITIAEANAKAVGFKMPIDPLKKKFFPSEETFEDCFEFGVNFAKNLNLK